MFTGLVEGLATVTQVVPEPPGTRLTIRAPSRSMRAEVGASIAVNGCCLTVVAVDGDQLAFQAGAETLGRTNLGELRPASQVNVEASLRLGDSLGGHLVTGHIDGLGTLVQRTDEGDWSTFCFQAPRELMRQMASKGSIAVDGVSLTLVDVRDTQFTVALIPHTLAVTTLGRLQPGMHVNLETDILAKYVQRQLERS
ncbi:MAG: riboflavin synthase subunit alpha [Planctomycetes bacterium RBG_16_64_10]|nr:MAG: riboflavin synthase subunit alpha [Planctomycetes bacterium RBG_16_64_10]